MEKIQSVDRGEGKKLKTIAALESNFRSQFGKQFAFAEVTVFDTLLIRFVSWADRAVQRKERKGKEQLACLPISEAVKC